MVKMFFDQNMFGIKDILSEEYSVAKRLYPLINDMHRLITDGKMDQAEYTPEQLKDDFGINFSGKVTITVTDDDGECWCRREGRNCNITISREIVNKKSAYEKIAHELTHFMRDQNYKHHDNSGNWKTGEENGFGSPEQIASYIVELYLRHELDAKVNEMYYRCINNPRIVCECIKNVAESAKDGEVKLYYNQARRDDNMSVINILFNELEETIHIGKMEEYYSYVANAVDGNPSSPVPVLMQWSNQRNFPFKIRSRDEKTAKSEITEQMDEIKNEYVESLVKVAKNLIKEMVKAFFNKGQESGQTENQQEENGQQEQQQAGQEQQQQQNVQSESKKQSKKVINEEKEMRANVLKFVNKLEGYKTAVKNLHWGSKNLSQHKLFDEIADGLADFQDKVSEVEQSMSGRLPMNKLSGEKYTISSPQKMLKDLLSDVKEFYNGLKNLGEDYIGMRSDCEAYISELQRQQYLLDFTLKEELKKRLKNALNG